MEDLKKSDVGKDLANLQALFDQNKTELESTKLDL